MISNWELESGLMKQLSAHFTRQQSICVEIPQRMKALLYVGGFKKAANSLQTKKQRKSNLLFFFTRSETMNLYETFPQVEYFNVEYSEINP